MVRFERTEASIGQMQIEQIQKLARLSFPKEYRDHLLKNNGGQCIPNIFSFNENGKVTSSCIDWFLAIYDGEYDNLKNYIEIYKISKKRIPSNMLPIAHDPGGNLICISCDGDDVGSIYFGDHEKEIDYSIVRDLNYSNLYLIAKGFNKFIDELR